MTDFKFIPNITNEEIQRLPLYAYTGDIEMVDTQEKYKKILPKLFTATDDNIWGFDTETSPSFVKGAANIKPVALLQLSNASTTYLFRLNKIGLPNEIKNLLSDSNYIKIGVSIKDDLKFLQKLNNFTPNSFIDLQKIVGNYGIEVRSLKKIAAIVLKYRISKAQQLSNWEAEVLNEKQIKYAATDSWACREIYKTLTNQK